MVGCVKMEIDGVDRSDEGGGDTDVHTVWMTDTYLFEIKQSPGKYEVVFTWAEHERNPNRLSNTIRWVRENPNTIVEVVVSSVASTEEWMGFISDNIQSRVRTGSNFQDALDAVMKADPWVGGAQLLEAVAACRCIRKIEVGIDVVGLAYRTVSQMVRSSADTLEEFVVDNTESSDSDGCMPKELHYLIGENVLPELSRCTRLTLLKLDGLDLSSAVSMDVTTMLKDYIRLCSIENREFLLTMVQLHRTKLDSYTLSDIAKYLRQISSLKYLDVSSNQLGNAAIAWLIEIMEHTALNYVDLSGNEAITDSGAMQWLGACEFFPRMYEDDQDGNYIVDCGLGDEFLDKHLWERPRVRVECIHESFPFCRKRTNVHHRQKRAKRYGGVA